MRLMIVLIALVSFLTSCGVELEGNAVKNTNKSLQYKTVKPTNILWVYIEDQNNWNNAYGDFTVKTPILASFANNGVRFNNAIQPAPVCSATRSALITGKYQTTLGVHQHRSFRSGYNGLFLPEGYKTVPELFADAGYETFNVGKDDYNFKYDRSKLYTAHSGKVGFQGAQYGVQFEWAVALKDKPFFGQIQLKGGKHKAFNDERVIDVNPEDMVLPLYYPDTPGHRRSWAHHYQTQIITDIELENILAELRIQGLLDNTAVFVFSDHGMELLRHKQELYEDSVKVPLLINWPAGNHLLRKKGAVREALISGLDITATSLALAGIDIPEYYDGKNIFAESFAGREYVISAKDRMDFTFDRGRSVRTERFRYIRNFHPEYPRSQPQYRDSRDYSIEFRKLFDAGKLTPIQERYFDAVKPAEELYDLNNDPHQIDNVANNPKFKSELTRHRQILFKWIEDTDDQGAYPESDKAIKEILDMWGKRCVSPACEDYRQRHSNILHIPGNELYPSASWPIYSPKPANGYYEKLESIYRVKFQ